MGRQAKGTGLAERAYLHVKNALLEGRFSEGDWLPIDEIAAQLSVSRQPVMDAMKRLSTEGFIEIVPQVGSRVRHHEPQEIKDFYRLYASAEALVAELAAQRATPMDIAHLRITGNQLTELFQLGLNEAEFSDLYRRFNRELHEHLRRIANSPSLTDIVQSLSDKSEFFVSSVNGISHTPLLEASHQNHLAVIAAVAAGNDVKAGKIMYNHIQSIDNNWPDIGRDEADVRSYQN